MNVQIDQQCKKQNGRLKVTKFAEFEAGDRNLRRYTSRSAALELEKNLQARVAI